jgi:hypothetical protein
MKLRCRRALVFAFAFLALHDNSLANPSPVSDSLPVHNTPELEKAFRIKVPYCTTHDCDDYSLNFCQSARVQDVIDVSNCATVSAYWDNENNKDNTGRPDNAHALNVVRFPKGNPHHSGSKSYKYCIVEPQSGEMKACWGSDGYGFDPPDEAFCQYKPTACLNGKKKEYGPLSGIGLGHSASETDDNTRSRQSNERWWQNPFNNTGALMNTCEKLNGDLSDTGKRNAHDPDLPACGSDFSCSQRDKAQACGLKSAKGGRNCAVRVCNKDGQWVFTNWREAPIRECDSLNSPVGRGRAPWSVWYCSQPREAWEQNYNFQYCRQKTSDPTGFAIRVFNCKDKKIIFLPPGNAHEPDLSRYQPLPEKRNTGASH